MYKLLAIVRDTFRELLVRKVIIGFLILNALVLVGIAFYVSTDMFSTFAERAHVPITDELKNQLVGILEIGVSGFFEVLMLLVALFATASVVSTMLEKGTIDLFLSKPISRPMLLFGKALGSVAVVASNITVYIFGTWLIISFKLGVWNYAYLLSGAIMLFSFIVLYGIVVLFNVITRGSVLGIIVTYVYVLIISGIIAARDMIFENTHNTIIKSILDACHWIFPQTKEISTISTKLIMHAPVESWMPFLWCGVYALVLYGAAGYLFSRKEF